MKEQIIFERKLKVGNEVYENYKKRVEQELEQRHLTQGAKDDINDEQELRNIIKQQKREIDFVLDRETD